MEHNCNWIYQYFLIHFLRFEAKCNEIWIGCVHNPCHIYIYISIGGFPFILRSKLLCILLCYWNRYDVLKIVKCRKWDKLYISKSLGDLPAWLSSSSTDIVGQPRVTFRFQIQGLLLGKEVAEKSFKVPGAFSRKFSSCLMSFSKILCLLYDCIKKNSIPSKKQ